MTPPNIEELMDVFRIELILSDGLKVEVEQWYRSECELGYAVNHALSIIDLEVSEVVGVNFIYEKYNEGGNE